jgi:hypothetical protein
MLHNFKKISINELTAIRLGIHGSIHRVFRPKSPMLQLSRALKHIGNFGYQKYMIWDPETLSVHIVMLYIGRQRKTMIVCSLSAV